MSDVSTAPKAPEAVQSERRAFGRRAMFRPATAVVLGGARWACIVVDKSETGARLKVMDRFDFPETFKLVLEDDNQVVQCQVVRRTEEFIAVEFVATPPVKAEASTLAPRVSTIRKKPVGEV